MVGTATPTDLRPAPKEGKLTGAVNRVRNKAGDVGDVTGPSGEPASVVLLNNHVVHLPSKHVYTRSWCRPQLWSGVFAEGSI